MLEPEHRTKVADISCKMVGCDPMFTRINIIVTEKVIIFWLSSFDLSWAKVTDQGSVRLESTVKQSQYKTA
jgi:hypothetical protein